MNKQGPKGIGWCDYTWNIVTGCWGPEGTAEKPNRCPYCYAKKMADRFLSDKAALVMAKSKEPEIFNAGPFSPMFWPERLDQPAKVKKPSKIFVCSMGDLFGDWVSREWIEQVIGTAWFVSPHHIYQFLTKNPKRLKDFNPWPSNCWIGTTVTNQADADERIPWLLQVDAPVLFVNHEPLLGGTYLNSPIPFGYIPDKWEAGTYEGHIDAFTGKWCPITNFSWLNGRFEKINWGIIGAMTGPGAVKPKSEWVRNLWEQYRQAGIPVFMKNNLKPIMGTLVQDFPVQGD